MGDQIREKSTNATKLKIVISEARLGIYQGQNQNNLVPACTCEMRVPEEPTLRIGKGEINGKFCASLASKLEVFSR